MEGFFSKFTGDDRKNKKEQGNNATNSSKKQGQFRNPFAGGGGGGGGGLGGLKKTAYRGKGQSLGGSKPGRVINVSLSDPGALGLEVEKRKNSEGTAIVSKVVPGSQADVAGLVRGDIICHPGSSGEHEVMYDQFVAMAKSGRRPLEFDVRRIDVGGGKTSSASSSSQGGNSGGSSSADAYARKQAVIAAAEARDRAHKAKTRPIPKKKSIENLPTILSTAEKRRIDEERAETARRHAEEGTNGMTDEARRAAAAAKADEQAFAAQLGYNPYETKKMSSGEAKTATVAMTHGNIDAGSAPAKISAGAGRSEAGLTPGNVNTPRDPVSAAHADPHAPINSSFDDAFAIVVTSNPDHPAVVRSLGVMRKLISNAITKGQSGPDETSSKFRRVRLSNPKIQEAIVNVHGGLELMLSTGFVLSENEADGETYLVFPPGDKGPAWLSKALDRMESYEKGS